MYAGGLLILKLNLPFVPAIILATILTGLISAGLGLIILDLDVQSVLVATLAFLAIIETLVVSEKWLTNGVKGIGPINYPFVAGAYTKFIYFLIVAVITAVLIIYARKLESSPPGRLLLSIQDNEPLAKSLGKPTYRQKLIFFTFTSALAGMFGALAAPVYNFLFPKYMTPAITFTIWIALILGARKRILGALVGIIATVGLFDVILESVVPIPSKYAGIMYNAKYFIYGITLVLVLMFRPSGILGNKKRSVVMQGSSRPDKTEG
jgi:branched-chain amino acid transport system permease protein